MQPEEVQPEEVRPEQALTRAEAMTIALAAAEEAAGHGDVPIGAALLDPSGRLVARAGNERELTGDPSAHAEILVLRRAAERAGDWHLDGHTLVVTLEPCTMCAGALVQARIGTLVFGAYDPKAGAVASLWDVVRDPRLNHRVEVVGGFRAAACSDLLQTFFRGHRGRPSPTGPGSPDDAGRIRFAPGGPSR